MFGDTIRDTFDAVLVTDPAVADQQMLERLAVRSNELRSWLDALDVRIARRAKVLTGTPSPSPGTPPSGAAADACATDTICAHGRRSRRDARAVSERSKVCDRMPGFEAALADGRITAGHVDAVAAATRRLDDAGKAAVDLYADTLLAAAEQQSVSDFERDARELARFLTADDGETQLERQKRESRVAKWIDRESGMFKLFAELDPETGAKVFAAIDASVRSHCTRDTRPGATTERLAVDALADLVTGARHDEVRVPEVYVHIDWATLVGGPHADTLCELDSGTGLPVETVRRMCCDAMVVPILTHDRTPIDAGRGIRTANRKQRRLLRSMYATCAHPACDVPFDACRIHHLVFWALHGLTDLANLLPLCNLHHHLVHEGGWRLTMTPDRVITLRRPDGSVAFTGSTCDRRRADDRSGAGRQRGGPTTAPDPPDQRRPAAA